jgi:hypothetical protein
MSQSRAVLLKQSLKLVVVLFVVGSLLRVVNGDPIDRSFIASFVGGAVVLVLAVVLLVPLLSPHLTPNPQLLWRFWQRAKSSRGADDSEAQR